MTPVTDQVFLINYKEALGAASSRFSDWLEDAIVRNLKLVAGNGAVTPVPLRS